MKIETTIHPGSLQPIQIVELRCPSCNQVVKINVPHSAIDWQSAYEELEAKFRKISQEHYILLTKLRKLNKSLKDIQELVSE